MLVGVTSSDPLTFLVIPLVLITAAAIACLVPARRASTIDPIVALRTE
jgi:ABC-type lipoprotein release transport system permease subunit